MHTKFKYHYWFEEIGLNVDRKQEENFLINIS